MRLARARLGQRGFSLIELVTVMAITGIVLVAQLSFLVTTNTQDVVFRESLDSEIDELRAVSLVETVFGQAIEIKTSGNIDLNAFASTNGTGRIREYDSNASWGATRSTDTLAVFWRDARVSSPTNPSAMSTELMRTAIYFQRPTLRTWGVLYVDLGNGIVLRPNLDDALFEGLTRVRITNIVTFTDPHSLVIPSVPPALTVTSFDLEMTFRRFLTGTPGTRLYCPDEIIATDPACAATATHRDISRVYRIIVKNAILGQSFNGPRAARIYDQIHFFAPNRDAGVR